MLQLKGEYRLCLRRFVVNNIVQNIHTQAITYIMGGGGFFKRSHTDCRFRTEKGVYIPDVKFHNYNSDKTRKEISIILF